MFIVVSADGFSRHLYDVRLVDVSHLSYMSYLAEITNAPTMFFAKCSILFQFRRLFCPGQIRDSTFWMIHALLFMCAAYYISAIFTFTFQCTCVQPLPLFACRSTDNAKTAREDVDAIP